MSLLFYYSLESSEQHDNLYKNELYELKRRIKMATIPMKRIFSKLFPKSLQTNGFKHVWAKYNKGHFGEAYAVFRDVIENQPRYSKVGDVYILWADLELLANHDPHKAIELLDKAQEIGCSQSQMAYYYAKRAEALWETGERHMALQCYERSVDADPSLPNLTNLGKVLTSSDDKHAIRIWRRVLEKDPNNCSAHIYLAQESVKSGDHGKAILMVKKAEKLKPKVSDFIRIGNLYRDLGQIQNALNSFLEAYHLGYEPKGPLYASISDCYFSLGEKKSARKYAEWAFQLDPNNDYVKEVWHDYHDLL